MPTKGGQGKRGGGSSHVALWEELRHLKLESGGKPVSIYKRLDVEKDKPLEDRSYYLYASL